MLIRKQTLKLIHDSASPDWSSVKISYVIVRFDDREDPKLACCKIAYEVTEGEIRKTNQIRMTMKIKEETEDEPVWEFSEIAIPDSPLIALTLYELLTGKEQPTKSKKKKRKKKKKPVPPPRQPHHCDKLPGNWNTYRWLSFDPEKHKGAIQGLAPKDWLMSK